jgi:4-amino-4-deoxy-L-arabinose transferase-like glycosyltransferase
MKIDRLKAGLLKLSLFCAAFTLFMVTGSVVFSNGKYGLRAGLLLPVMGCAAAVFSGLDRLIARHGPSLKRRYWWIVGVCILAVMIANIAHGAAMRYVPSYDLGAIYNGAIGWAEQGSFMASSDRFGEDYFYYFPNNIGGMALLLLPFRLAALLGLRDYYMAAVIFATLLVGVTLLTMLLISRRLFGEERSLLVLAFMLLFPPTCFMGVAFYTDTLAMPFPVMAFYLYLRFRDCRPGREKWLYAALIAISMAVGMQVKFTSVITLIAIILYHLLSAGKTAEEVLQLFGMSGIMIACVILTLNGVVYSGHLDQSRAKALNTPYLHWIMMGLKDEGRYNPNDYAFTRSFKDTDDRDRALREEIFNRIRANGVEGMLDLWNIKAVIDFGDGTLAQSDFFDDFPQNDTALNDLVLYGGERFQLYRYLCSGVYLLFVLYSAIGALRGIRAPSVKAVLPIALWGLTLFLMLWEATGRYASSYLPMFVLGAMGGWEEWTSMLRNTAQ